MPWLTLWRKDKKLLGQTAVRGDEAIENAQFRVLQNMCRESGAYWELRYTDPTKEKR